MSFLPLTLGVGHAPGAGGGGAKPPAKAESQKILERDGYACRFCGFQSAQYQRVVPVAQGYVTACGFCEQVMSLERAGLMGGGYIIWLPELSQIQLNHIVRAIYVARAAADDAPEIAADASRALDALTARRTEAKKRLGSDDPLVLATVLHENLDNDAARAEAARKMDGARLLPFDKYMVRGAKGDINGFPQMVKFWRSDKGPFGRIPVATWRDLLAKTAA